MKFTKSLAALATVSFGMMFVAAANVNASSTTKHTIQEGDTISGLAKQYKVSQKKLQKANKHKDINRIYVGEVFIFDGKGNVKVDKKSVVKPSKSNTTSNDNASSSTNNSANDSAVSSSAASKQTVSTTTTSTVASAPVAQAAPAPVVQASAPVVQAAPAPAVDATMDGIAQAESGNNYNARNGQYIGKYQLSASYLNGDYSPANQERVAQQYAVSRYGSVAAAAAYHAAHGSW